MKCNVSGCKNQDYQVEFIGNLCLYCHTFLTEVYEGTPSSQAARNFKDFAKLLLKECEFFMIETKYK